MAGYVAFKSPRALVNRLCLALLSLFVIFSLDNYLQQMPGTSAWFISYSARYLSIGWIGIAGLFLWFVLALIGNRKIYASKPLIFVILLIPALLYFREVIGLPLQHLEPSYFGWETAWNDSIWTTLFYGYYILFSLAAVLALAVAYRRATSVIKRRQYAIVLLTFIVATIVGSTTDIVLPAIGVSFPSIADLAALIWAGGLVYAITKYGLLVSSFSAFANQIISSMSEALILLDNENKITIMNDAARAMFGVGKDFQGNFSDVVKQNGGAVPASLTKLNQGKKSNEVFEFKDKDGKIRSLLFSGSPFFIGSGESAGVICLFNDISEQKRFEKDLSAVNQNLKEKIDDLEKFQKIVIDRELKMVELKKEIEILKNTNATAAH